MKHTKYPPLSKETKRDIIEYFKKTKDNTTRSIALEFNCKEHQVIAVIDEYLSKINLFE